MWLVEDAHGGGQRHDSSYDTSVQLWVLEMSLMVLMRSRIGVDLLIGVGGRSVNYAKKLISTPTDGESAHLIRRYAARRGPAEESKATTVLGESQVEVERGIIVDQFISSLDPHPKSRYPVLILSET